MRHIEIGGMLRPCSFTSEENEQVVQGTKYSTTEKFLDMYNTYLGAMGIVAECAKSYIEKNWEKIKDWSDLNVIILDATKKTTEYYNYKPEKNKNRTRPNSAYNSLLNRLDIKNKAKHNPVTTLTGVVLDPTDGDFSVTINGHCHLWIDDESVIIIADFIENQLKNEKDNSHK